MSKTTPILFIFLMSFSLNALAISEMNYKAEYANKISPLLSQMPEGYFVGSKNVKIHYRTYKQVNAKNCLVILPGRTEPIEKYAEVVFDLIQSEMGKNLNFFLMDHRGQGKSERMAAPKDMGHIDQFKYYVDDVETFISQMNLEKACEHKFLLAHSMGAGIATAYILKNPTTFEKVALSSPMLKILTKPYPYLVARTIVSAQTLAGKGAMFAIGQKGFNTAATFENNTFTTSPERFSMTMEIFNNNPSMQVGGVSNQWILEIMKGTNKFRSHFHEISTPMRVFAAGNEQYSEPSEMVNICREAANCRFMLLATSKHEVLMDRDINRNKVLSEIENFFQ